FQAEDGIRDLIVTGVQTCALPICLAFSIRDTGGANRKGEAGDIRGQRVPRTTLNRGDWRSTRSIPPGVADRSDRSTAALVSGPRSEERRVGKEGGGGWAGGEEREE